MLNFLVYSNIWVSFCAAMLSFGFSSTYHLESITPFVFFTTLLVYTGQRYYKIHFTTILVDTPRIEWMKKNKKNVESILAAALIGVLVYGLPLVFASKFNFSIIAFCALVSILYVVKIGKHNLREIPGLKVFLITLVFFVFVFILPYQSLERVRQYLNPFWFFMTLFGFQYLYILGITILFDIPDIKNDSKSLKTIAQMIGEKRTVLSSILLISPIFCLLMPFYGNQLSFWLFAAIHFPFYFFLLRSKQKHFYLAFFGEGILGLLGLYYVLM